MNLLSPFNYLGQKLLYLWVKTDILQVDDSIPHDDENTVVIYVMESRAWTDLLVVEHECKTLKTTRPQQRIKHSRLHKWHHVYTVAQAQPLKAWLQQKTKRSKMLIGIDQILRESPEIDVLFVPVVVFWGRPVMKQKHWLHVLFSETWGLAGRIRRFFTILFNGRSTMVEFSSAISYREVIDESSPHENTVDLIQAKLSARLTEIKTATLGPDISHRRTLVRKLLENPSISLAIDQRAAENNISVYKATRTAEKYLNEIVADRSYVTIQLLQRILTTFWNRFYSGIKVHHSSQLKQLALTHELIYVPCHRSHIDYLLLSYVIHFEGLAIPYIAAGRNLNMPIIGPILRKGGAFFIRRSFRGNPLYSTVMFEYLASQLSTGMPIEYFIEGGRSRTGRLLQPKPGMLAMTIRAFLKYKRRPIAFIPVHIGYEKMIEGKSYLTELKGGDKKSETLLSSIHSFFRIRGFYGQVTTSFGEPVLLSEVLDGKHPGWEHQAYRDDDRPDWLISTVNRTSVLIMQRINQSCSVNAVNLIATALLASPNQTMDETELLQTLTLYTDLIQHLGYSERITITRLNPEEQIALTEKLGLVRRRKHEMGDFIYLDNKHAVRLTYYRNNIIHLLAIPSLIACCFNNTSALGREQVIRFLIIVYPFLKYELFLTWPMSDIADVTDNMLKHLSSHGIINYNEGADIYTKPQISTDNHAQLTTLGKVISPVLELYFMIYALLAEQGSDTLTRERLEELCYLMAQRLSLMYEINSPDFFDKKLIANFIDSLIRCGYVIINDSGKLELIREATRQGWRSRRLLDKNMQYHILQMLRTTAMDHENV